MQVNGIRDIVERQPFRPFGVRLSNGAEYVFTELRQFGAPLDLQMIFYFGESGAVRIETENIVEVFEKR